jgi:hypothetical protein
MQAALFGLTGEELYQNDVKPMCFLNYTNEFSGEELFRKD